MKACGILMLFLAGSLVARADDDTVTLPETAPPLGRLFNSRLSVS